MRIFIAIANLRPAKSGDGFSFGKMGTVFTVDDYDDDIQFAADYPIDKLENQIENVPIKAETGPRFSLLQQVLETHYGFQIHSQITKSDDGVVRDGIYIRPPQNITVDRFASQTDFFDTLRDFDTALAQLSEHLRGINDPRVMDARLRLVRASVEAMRCYIDIDNEDGPEEIPHSVSQELNANLDRIDWSKFSSEARGWAKYIKDIVVEWLKSDSS
ncbi:MAG: hypothetical protein ABJP66_06900 [Hyphomicrobiales bacterium]